MTLRRKLAIRLRHWAPEEPEILLVRHSLARCLFDLARFDEAEEQLRAALTGLRADELVRPEVLLLRWTLAQVLIARRDVDAARAVLTDLLDDRERVVGERHPDTIATRDTLARLVPYAPPRQPGRANYRT
ncbi:tetratricopeptide repeat protein [Micromonospora sp. NPDC050980]|uniref:tetratricopeptide repeat protein n=1 Tax=Micromonospora sp. NPDC050980 TaxID=3155161 RepID=UPI0033EEBD58